MWLFVFFLFLIPTVWICAYGRTDMKGILKSVSKRDYYRYIIYTAEKTKTCRKMPSGSDANSGCQEVFIADMDQLCLDQLSYKPGTSSDDC